MDCSVPKKNIKPNVYKMYLQYSPLLQVQLINIASVGSTGCLDRESMFGSAAIIEGGKQVSTAG